jgi:hypothetical protein
LRGKPEVSEGKATSFMSHVIAWRVSSENNRQRRRMHTAWRERSEGNRPWVESLRMHTEEAMPSLCQTVS